MKVGKCDRISGAVLAMARLFENSVAKAIVPSTRGLSHGVALAPDLRSFLESRFGTDFVTVRIHTGAWASTVARSLGARAFTFGHDIVFGEGEYAPDNREGLRLLAHELTHVIQQRQTDDPRTGAGWEIGEPWHLSEAEAELAADQVLLGRRPAVITPDRARVIRRAIVINTSSATIAVDKVGAEPAVAVAPSKNGPSFKGLLHLTRGAKISEWSADPSASGRFDPAIKMTGRVDVACGVDQLDTLKGFEFNFIQFGNLVVVSNLYGGRRPNDGSIEMNFAVPPALLKNPSLDSGTLEFPFTKHGQNSPARMTSSPKAGGLLVRVESEMGDHPTRTDYLEFPNTASHAPNFMFNMRWDIELTTCFVVRSDITAPPQFLAHFSWHIIHDVNFRWNGGVPVGEAVNRRLDVGTIKLGPPNPLPNVAAPFTNQLAEDAHQAVLRQGKPPNLVESLTRDPRVPVDFFT